VQRAIYAGPVVISKGAQLHARSNFTFILASGAYKTDNT
jgi:hypothetical protein